MDWNWFFSALAQSAAAIVAIFAGFIITKIINNQADFKRKLSELQSIRASCTRLVDQINSRYIGWYNKQIREKELGKLESLILQHNSEDPQFYYRKLGFSVYDVKEEILQMISEKISQLKRSTVEKKASSSITSTDLTPLLAPNWNVIGLESAAQGALQISLENESELIETALNDIKDQARRVENYLSQVETNPESSTVVTMSIVLILIMFFVGVIYPLSFLPQENKALLQLSIPAFFDILFSLKGLILSIVSVIFSLVMVIFLVTNIRLKYPTEQIQDIKKYSDIKNYSCFLENKVKNLS